jgi:hypothetical protein
MVEELAKFAVIDNPLVTESYANKLISTSFDGGSIIITFGAVRYATGLQKEGTPPPVHVTARLALSPAGAVELVNVVTKLLATLSQIQKDKADLTKPAKKRT